MHPLYARQRKPRKLEEVSHFFLSERPVDQLPVNFSRVGSESKGSSPSADLSIPTVGIIIVDRKRVMRFANPVAKHMLGLKSEDVGQLFNFYIAVEEVSEVSILREDRKPGIASMQIGETEWCDEFVYFAVMRDVTRSWRKKGVIL